MSYVFQLYIQIALRLYRKNDILYIWVLVYGHVCKLLIDISSTADPSSVLGLLLALVRASPVECETTRFCNMLRHGISLVQYNIQEIYTFDRSGSLAISYDENGLVALACGEAVDYD